MEHSAQYHLDTNFYDVYSNPPPSLDTVLLSHPQAHMHHAKEHLFECTIALNGCGHAEQKK